MVPRDAERVGAVVEQPLNTPRMQSKDSQEVFTKPNLVFFLPQVCSRVNFECAPKDRFLCGEIEPRSPTPTREDPQPLCPPVRVLGRTGAPQSRPFMD